MKPSQGNVLYLVQIYFHNIFYVDTTQMRLKSQPAWKCPVQFYFSLMMCKKKENSFKLQKEPVSKKSYDVTEICTFMVV